MAHELGHFGDGAGWEQEGVMAGVMTARERLLRLLFRDGAKHRDIKFMRGDDLDVSQDAFCDAAAATLLRQQTDRLKPITELPRSNSRTNIDKLVETL